MALQDRKLVQVWLPTALAERFAALARQQAGSGAAMLRQLIATALEAPSQAVPRGVGQGRQIAVRLKTPERAALAVEAHRRGMTPTQWVRALVLAQLARRPQWAGDEIEALRTLYGELGRIGNNVNQIARATNAAVQRGEQSSEQGTAAREAVERLSSEMDKLAELVIRNGCYWDVAYTAEPQVEPPQQKPRRRRGRRFGPREDAPAV